jgi:hypothetical protein
MTRRVAILSLMAMFSLGACETCANDHTVPFRLGEQGDREGLAAPGTEPQRAAFVGVASTAVPKGTIEIEVDGARVSASPSSLLAVLPVDVDRDGTRDVVLLGLDPQQTPFLMWRKRGGAQYEEGAQLTLGALPEGCTLESAELRTISPRYATATLTEACGNAEARLPRRELLLVDLQGTTDIEERFAWMLPEPRNPSSFAVDITTADRDGDQTEDVIATVATLDREGARGRAVEIVWFDRPAGLARDARAPVATFDAWFEEARQTLSATPRETATQMDAILKLHRALCPESGGAELAIEVRPPIACGQWANVQRVAVVLALARAKLAEPGLAVDAYLAARSFGTVDDRLAAQLVRAFGSLTVTRPSVLRTGPTLAELEVLPPQAGRDAKSVLDYVRDVSAPTLLLPTANGVVTLDVSTLPVAGEPPRPDDAPPPPSLEIPVGSDVAYVAKATPFGLFVESLGEAPEGFWLRPDTWPPVTEAPHDLLAFPGGKLVAFVADGRVYVLERR